MSISTNNSSKYNPISLTGTLHCPIYKIIMSISLKLSTSTYISFGPLLLDHPPSIPFHPTYTLYIETPKTKALFQKTNVYQIYKGGNAGSLG